MLDKWFSSCPFTIEEKDLNFIPCNFLQYGDSGQTTKSLWPSVNSLENGAKMTHIPIFPDQWEEMRFWVEKMFYELETDFHVQAVIGGSVVQNLDVKGSLAFLEILVWELDEPNLAGV